MGLRADWQNAKASSEKKYKAEMAKRLKLHGPSFVFPGFPKFSKGLGPALDAWEKERDGNKKKKLGEKIRVIIKEYNKLIGKFEKFDFSDLEDALIAIQDKMGMRLR